MDMSWRRYIRKSLEVVREEGAVVFVRRAGRNLRIRGRRLLSPYHRQNLKRWQGLRNIYQGQRAFLVGNGPSLNATPLHLLAGENTLCFNRFNLMFERLNWRPTMYMNVDSSVASDMAAEIRGIIREVDYAFLPDIHSDGTAIRAAVGDVENIYWLYPDFRGFYDALPRVGLGGTVAFSGIQVLIYMGFNPIYLVGVDATYRIHETADPEGDDVIRSRFDDDPNHFDPRYFGTGRKYHQPDAVAIGKMRKAFSIAAVEAAKRHKDILNASVGGALEVFPRTNLRSLLAGERSDHWERNAIMRAVRVLRPVTEEDLFGCAVESTPSGNLVAVPVFALEPAKAQAWAPRLIATHVPFGPIADGRTFFVSRPTALALRRPA